MAASRYTESSTLFDTSETINAIVARYPAAVKVLAAFGLDTCCGGALPLHVAAAQHGLDSHEVADALRKELESER